MTMKSNAFGSANASDYYYSLIGSNSSDSIAQFWQIYAANCTPSHEFKCFVESLFKKNPGERISIKQIKSHP